MFRLKSEFTAILLPNRVLATVFFAVCLFAHPVFAQSNPDEELPVDELTRNEQAIDQVQQPFMPTDMDAIEEKPKTNPTPPDSIAPDPCDWNLSSPNLQEDSREVVRGVTCHTYRWFDGLFGDSEDYPEDEIYGLLTVGAAYRQYDGFDPRLRFRARAPLPNVDNRFDLFLGRGDEDAFISDTQTQDSTFYNPGLVNTDAEESWLVGLGHRRGGRRKGWDWSIGAKLRFPPVPYVKARWYYDKAFSRDTELRFRHTFFWRSDDGFGMTARADTSHSINPNNVLRWEAVATVSEEASGADWYFGQTWYHLLGDNGAFSVLAFARGETDWEVPLKEYGLNLIWRRNFTRDWLWLSLGPTITWPREFEDEERELSLGFGAWIEMEFGGYWYRKNR